MSDCLEELHTVQDFKDLAQERLTPLIVDYYVFPGQSRQTYKDSIDAYQRYRFRPQILNDVSVRRLSTTLLGHRVSVPIGVAPTALHLWAHEDGEIATAKGTLAADTVVIQSCFSNKHVSAVSAAVPGGLKWMQAYIWKDRRITEYYVRQAEAAGYKAIILTVDSPKPGLNPRGYKRSFSSVSDEQQWYANIDFGLPEVEAAKKKSAAALGQYFLDQFDSSITWGDIAWLRSVTSLPIVCKGILTGKAAKQATDAGAAGILVSAHGGRQLDGVPAPIDALSEVVEAVRGRNVEVYIDGGVRTGSDVLKALAKGARAVFVGRPILWGLACGGSSGVNRVLEILRKELDYAMALCGCSDVNAIPADAVVHESYFNIPKHKL